MLGRLNRTPWLQFPISHRVFLVAPFAAKQEKWNLILEWAAALRAPTAQGGFNLTITDSLGLSVRVSNRCFLEDLVVFEEVFAVAGTTGEGKLINFSFLRPELLVALPG